MISDTVRTVLGGLLLILFTPVFAVAQTGTIEGTVIDAETAESLPGASVVVVGPELGTATDLDGTFAIENVPEGTYIVRASFVGFHEQEQEVSLMAGETATLNFELEADVAGLEEVIVTGLGIQRERGRAQVAVSRIDAENLTENARYQDVSQLISGNVPGVQVQSASGNIGGGIRFNVRGGGGLGGAGQPVIYVDGTRVDNNEIEGFGAGGQGVSSLADLNPEDIASIDVIRGPAGSAIYGTEGANGVVLITTRRGQFSPEPTFNVQYRGTFGWNEQEREFDPNIWGTAPTANALFRQGAIVQNNVSASGGTESVRYFASIDRRYEEGHLPRNQGDRTNVRANFEAFPTDKITLEANAGFTVNIMERPDNDNNVQGFLGNTLLFPTTFVFTDSLAILAMDDVHRVNRFIGSVTARYSPARNLEIRGTAGYDASTRRQDRTRPVGFAFSGIGTSGERNFFTRINQQLNADLQIQYSYDLGGGLFATTLVGGVFQDRTLRTAFGTAQGFATDRISNIGAGDDFTTLNEDFLQRRTGGLLAAQEFVLNDTYFLSGNIRRDVATELGEGISDVFYPSVSASIRLDQFGFIPDAFTLLRPRVAYGETGELPAIEDGQPIRFEAVASGFGGGGVVGSIGDALIVPERVQEFEGGIDVELWDRISIESTYFRSFANNSIVDRTLASSTGFRSGLALPQNVGSIVTQGVEVGLGVTPVAARNVRLDLTLNYAFQTSEVRDLGAVDNIFDGFNLNVLRPGVSRSAFFTQRVLGAVFDEDGQAEFTAAGTQRIELSDEREVVGQPIPEHFGSFRFNLNLFRDLNLSGLAEFALGHQVYNNTRLWSANTGNMPRRNDLFDLLDETEPGTQAHMDAANELAFTDPRFDANFIEDADYLKMREVTVRYNFSRLLHRTGFDGVRNLSLGLSARNLFTITGYSGPDPEINFDGSRSLSRGQDFLTLPTPRQFYMTVTVGL